MPKWANRLPEPRRHKPSGQARIRLNGRDLYLGRWGSAEAKRKYRELLATWGERGSLEPDGHAVHSPVTVSIAIYRFWQWAEHRYRDAAGESTRTAENYRPVLRLVRQRFGELPLDRFGPAKLLEVQGALVAQGLARSTVNTLVGKVRRFFRWAVSRELVSESAYRALCSVEALAKGQGARETLGRRRPVEWGRVEATLPHLPLLLRALVMVLWHTGARVGEIRGLTTSMIDQTGDVWKAIPEKHKTAHHGLGRTIYLGPRAIQALRPWLRPDEPDAAIFAPARSSGRTAKRTGRLRPFYSRVSLPQAIRRGCARAGVEPWTLAQLRHSRATQIREHHDLDAATVVLGHTRPTMTMHYSREAIAHAVEVVRVVG